MSATCPCCGSAVAKPFVASIDTSTVSTAHGSIRVSRCLFDAFASIASVYPGARRADQIMRDVYGILAYDKATSSPRGMVHKLRKLLSPIGIEISSSSKGGYRLLVKTASARRAA